MDKEQLCESLLIWLQTFNVSGARSAVSDVTDGVTMAQVLHQIAPNFFSDSWMSRIKTDVGNNWRLKVINLKKVLKGILDYYSDVLGQQIHDFHMPDVSAIGEHDDPNELGRLLQLILGCAVNCDSKQEYIERIMAMEESVQHGVMKAIQELMTKEAPASVEGYSELGDQLKKTVGELNTAIEQKDEIAQRCHELDLQVASLQEERANLLAENEKLNDRLNQSDFLDDSSPAGRKHQQLQNQIEQLQEELDRSDAGKEDLRIKVELQEKEISELQQKNEEMSGLAEEAMTLKDEIDILRHSADKVTKYEATIESYKKKIQELSDFKGRIKMLEEKNTAFVQKNMELEEENRKLHLLKSQLDMYKRQIQEVQMKMADETKRGDKAEFELKRQQEKMVGLQKEKERLMMERDSLKETNEELRCMQGTQGIFDRSSSYSDSLDGEVTMALSGSPGSLDMMAVPPDVKEKMIRLQHENKMLRVEQTDRESEQGQLLQSQLDDANARKNELESEVRIANQRVLELEARIEDMHEGQQDAITSAVATATAAATAAAPPSDAENSKAVDLEKQLAELQTESSRLQAELDTRTSQLEEKTSQGADLGGKVTALKKSVKELKDSLERKDDEMRAMEERYRRYLEKAKNVIKNLDPAKLNASASPDVFALRNQLQEKTQLIGSLEKDRDTLKRIREQEEKLVVTAWYNLVGLSLSHCLLQVYRDTPGTQLNRAAMEERLSNSSGGGSGKSFLARQRQPITLPALAVGVMLLMHK